MEDNIFLANQKLELAQKSFDSEKFDDAIAFCEQAIELNPKNNLQANLLLGRAYYEKVDRKAKNYFDSVIAMNQNFAEGYFYKGLAIIRFENNFNPAVKRKNLELAVKNFDKAIELKKKAEFYFWRGFVQLNFKNFSVAIENFTKAAELAPTNSAIFYRRGSAYSEMAEFEKAVEDFNKAIELSPENYLVYYGRAFAYANLKNKNLALKDIQKYLELSEIEESGFTYRILGKIYFLLGEYEQALKNFNKVIECNPRSTFDYYLRGKTFFEMKDYRNALNDLDKCIMTYYRLSSVIDELEKFRNLCLENLSDSERK